MHVGERIKHWRIERSFGQADLARHVGITPNALYRIEAGQRTPRPDTLRKVAEVLRVEVSILREGNTKADTGAQPE